MVSGMVSVIIPTHNRPHYLSEAVESVLAQTYPHLEIIVVDDGSAGGGAETQKAIAPYLHLPHFSYVYHDNRGIGATVNRGLSLARGEYIQRLDDDDRLLPKKVARSVEALAGAPTAGLVATGYHLIDSSGQRYQTLSPRPCPNPARLLNMLLHCVSAQAAVMVRAGVHQKVGRYHNGLSGEDYIMWIRIAREFDVVTLDEPLAEYRRHPGNTTVESHQPRLEREMMGFLIDILRTTPLEALIPGLESKAHGHALRAAVLLSRDRPHLRTPRFAREELIAARQLAPADPLLSLWNGVLAIHGDNSLRPLPWEASLAGAYHKKEVVHGQLLAAQLGDLFVERERLSRANLPASHPSMVGFRRDLGRLRFHLMQQTFQTAIGQSIAETQSERLAARSLKANGFGGV